MASPTTSPARIRILLVDDSDLVRNLLKHALAASNPSLEVHEAGSGAEALRKIGTSKPDVVMLDLNLPDMRGQEVANQIRQTLPSTKIVLCSLNDAQVLAEISHHAGADAFISKTASLNEFAAMVASLAGKVRV